MAHATFRNFYHKTVANNINLLYYPICIVTSVSCLFLPEFWSRENGAKLTPDDRRLPLMMQINLIFHAA